MNEVCVHDAKRCRMPQASRISASRTSRFLPSVCHRSTSVQAGAVGKPRDLDNAPHAAPANRSNDLVALINQGAHIEKRPRPLDDAFAARTAVGYPAFPRPARSS